VKKKESEKINLQTTHKNKPILVAGGAGYIGTHVVIELLNAGFTDVVVIDNFVNSSPESIQRVEKITRLPVKLYNFDIAKKPDMLDEICAKHRFYCCIHLAGLKAVGESVQLPLLYYRNNLLCTMNLLESLSKNECNHFIFSSSACVYGKDAPVPYTEKENIGQGINSPYGKTKYFSEEIIRDFVSGNPAFHAIILRYFNPIGAHESGMVGEDPQGIHNNLMPYLTQVAVGRRPYLSVFGDDYPTPDGTGVRDYIHIVDLAQGHVAALENGFLQLEKGDLETNKSKESSTPIETNSRCSVYNLGSGCGTSVMQLLHALEKACGKKLEYKILPRREGDIAEMYADSSLVEKTIHWKAKLSIEKACEDSWRWQSNNPMGYKTAPKDAQ